MRYDARAATVDWLFANAGPILRWRLVQDFSVPLGRRESAALRDEVLTSAEVRRWLDNLGVRGIHGSKDTNAENAIAKLVEYGVKAGMPELDEKMQRYVERIAERRGTTTDIVAPFLIAAGYADRVPVRAWFLQRLQALHEMARQADYDLYLPPSEAQDVPKAWRGRRVYRFRFLLGESVLLPSCYDLYALAHWPHTAATRKKAEAIVAFISRPEFQETLGGCLWDRQLKRCHSAGRVWLACCEPQRVVLFLELAARFASARRSAWFQEALRRLDRYRTDSGHWLLPPDHLKEKPNSYYIYQGVHMGLGENRRKRNWRELESTFRMLNIERLMRS